MIEIEIKKNKFWQYYFKTSNVDNEIYNTKEEQCYYCNLYLNKIYFYILNCLREAGLLPKDYKPLCCYCKVLIEFDLLYLRQSLSMVHYITELDIFVLSFIFGAKELNVNIHDFKKIR